MAVKSCAFNDFGVENNDKDPNFEVGDHVRIPQYKNIFVKGYAPSQSEDIFVTATVKNTVPWMYVIEDPTAESVFGKIDGKELQSTNQREVTIEKLIKK